MKKQKKEYRLEKFVEIDEKDLKSIEKIWKISKTEFPEITLEELENYPDIIKKTKASLKIIVENVEKKNNNNGKVSSEDLTGPVLEIINCLIADMYRKHLKNEKGCMNMYA